MTMRVPFEPTPQGEVDAELAFHLEERVRDYVARGMDPLTLGATAALLVACAVVALLGPVRRATRVDPITVLR